MMTNKVYELADGSSKFLRFENGTFAVYDGWDYEHCPNVRPEFVGHYDDSVAYITKCEREALESILC